MTIPVFAALLLLVVLAALGWPLARLVGGALGPALALTPAAAGVVVSISVGASVATRTSMAPWCLLAAVLGWGVLAARRGRPWVTGAEPTTPPIVLAAAVAVALVPVVLVQLPPIESDSLAIWWFHAAWFREGGDVTWEAMSVPSFQFTHPGYPPLLSGIIAAAWHLGGAFDREVALRVSQLFNAVSVAGLGYLVSSALRLPRRAAVVVAVASVAVSWGANAGVGLKGFADLTWAVPLVAASVLALAGPLDRRARWMAAVLLLAAALTKLEAQPVAVLLVLLTVVRLVRLGRSWRQVAPMAGALVLAVVPWTLLTSAAGVTTTDRGDWALLGGLADPTSVVRRRIDEALPRVLDELGPLLALATVGVLAAIVAGRLAGRPLAQPGLLALLALAAGQLLVVLASCAVAPDPVSIYLDYGLFRYVVFTRLLVLTDVVIAWVAVARAVGALPAPAGSPGELVPASIHR